MRRGYDYHRIRPKRCVVVDPWFNIGNLKRIAEVFDLGEWFHPRGGSAWTHTIHYM